MQQPHQLDITVQNGGDIKLNIQYRDHVPDLMSRFSDEVRKRARYWFLWPTPYERKLWKAIEHAPRWARETVRQHILHERALRIDQRLKERAAKAAAKEKTVQVTAHRAGATDVAEVRPELEVAQLEPAGAVGVVWTDRAASTALSSVAEPALSLTEQLAAAHGTPPVVPPKVLRHHGRSR